MRKLGKIYGIAFRGGGLATNAKEVVSAMTMEGIDQAALETIPFGVSLPLREACVFCRSSPPADWSASSYELVGRPDLFAQSRGDQSALTLDLFQAKLTPPPPPPRPPPDVAGESKRLLQLQQRAAGIQDALAPSFAAQMAGREGQAGEAQQQQRDGAECDDPVVAMIFSSDKRIQEAQRMLQSSERVRIAVAETTGAEWAAEQQEALVRVAQRTLALPVGRGAFALSLDRTPSSEQLRFPQFMFDGKNLSEHDVGFENKPQGTTLVWPHFHNGVATALRIAAGRERVTHAWMSYNQQLSDLHDVHAGFLLGLGLQGHFPRSPTVKSLELLDTHHGPTMVAVLLSHAASNAGTMNEAVTKELCMHVPFLRPAAAASPVPGGAGSIEVQTETIAAALVGVGLVFRGTGHRRMVETLLEELSTQPSTRALHGRECYALAAGFGLGLAALGRGYAIPGAGDLRIVDALSKLISGGPEPEARKQARKQEAAAAAQSQKPVLFLTNGWIDMNVTAPGAIMALCMMFLQTNNRVAECELRVPKTRAELDAVRPDHLLLRVLAKNLIMWDSVQPTESWIASEVPAFVNEGIASADSNSAFLSNVRGAIVTGACLAIGMRFAGTGDRGAKEALLSTLRRFMAPSPPAISASERIARSNKEMHVDDIAIVSGFIFFLLLLLLLLLF